MTKIIFLLFLTTLIVFGADSSIYSKKINDYKITLQNIEARIKRENKALKQLSGNLINNEVSTSKLLISFINHDTSFFEVASMEVFLNGESIFSKKGLTKKVISIRDGNIDPGKYNLKFKIKLVGAGYKIFTYMKTYKLTINREVNTTITDLGTSIIKFNIFKKGDFGNKNLKPEDLIEIKIENNNI